MTDVGVVVFSGDMMYNKYFSIDFNHSVWTHVLTNLRSGVDWRSIERRLLLFVLNAVKQRYCKMKVSLEERQAFTSGINLDTRDHLHLAKSLCVKIPSPAKDLVQRLSAFVSQSAKQWMSAHLCMFLKTDPCLSTLVDESRPLLKESTDHSPLIQNLITHRDAYLSRINREHASVADNLERTSLLSTCILDFEWTLVEGWPQIDVASLIVQRHMESTSVTFVLYPGDTCTDNTANLVDDAMWDGECELPRDLENFLDENGVARYTATILRTANHVVLAYDSHFSMIADLYNCLSSQDVLVSWNLRTDLVTLLRNCRLHKWTEFKRVMDPLDDDDECLHCVSDLHYKQEIPALARTDIPISYETWTSPLTETRLQQLLDTKGWKELGVVWPPGSGEGGGAHLMIDIASWFFFQVRSSSGSQSMKLNDVARQILGETKLYNKAPNSDPSSIMQRIAYCEKDTELHKRLYDTMGILPRILSVQMAGCPIPAQMFCLADNPVRMMKISEIMISAFLQSPMYRSQCIATERRFFLPKNPKKQSAEETTQAETQVRSLKAGIFVAALPGFYREVIAVGDFSSFYPGMVNETSNICISSYVPPGVGHLQHAKVHAIPGGKACTRQGDLQDKEQFDQQDLRHHTDIVHTSGNEIFLDHKSSKFVMLPRVMKALVDFRKAIQVQAELELEATDTKTSYWHQLKAMSDQVKFVANSMIGCLVNEHSCLYNPPVAQAVYWRQRAFLATMVQGFAHMRECKTCGHVHHFLVNGQVEQHKAFEDDQNSCPSPEAGRPLCLLGVTTDSLTFKLPAKAQPYADEVVEWVVNRLHEHYTVDKSVTFGVETVAKALLQLRDRSQVLLCTNGKVIYKGATFNKFKGGKQQELNRLLARVLLGCPPSVEEAIPEFQTLLGSPGTDGAMEAAPGEEDATTSTEQCDLHTAIVALQSALDDEANATIDTLCKLLKVERLNLPAVSRSTENRKRGRGETTTPVELVDVNSIENKFKCLF